MFFWKLQYVVSMYIHTYLILFSSCMTPPLPGLTMIIDFVCLLCMVGPSGYGSREVLHRRRPSIPLSGAPHCTLPLRCRQDAVRTNQICSQVTVQYGVMHRVTLGTPKLCVLVFCTLTFNLYKSATVFLFWHECLICILKTYVAKTEI